MTDETNETQQNKNEKRYKQELNREGRKPHRLVTPTFVRVLTAVGLTDLSDEEVRQYKTVYNSHYGSLQARGLRALHRIGLTDLTDEEVERYVENSRKLERDKK